VLSRRFYGERTDRIAAYKRNKNTVVIIRKPQIHGVELPSSRYCRIVELLDVVPLE
jgi:hypothetical protein